MSQRPLGELDVNVKHKQTNKRKNRDSEVQENVSSPETKKRIRRRSSVPGLTERPLKKINASEAELREGAVVDTFDRAFPEHVPLEFKKEMEKEMEKEKTTRVDGKYLFQTREVTAQQRLNGLNQIALIHVVQRTSPETVFLATSIFDRYLSQTLALPSSDVLKLALASFFLACKYEQFPIPLNFHLAQLSMSLLDLLEMEKKVLKVLDWNLSVPTPLTFLHMYLKVSPDNEHSFLSNYILELSHRESNMLNHYPSKIAASVMMVSNKMLSREAWPSQFAEFTGYKEEDIFEPANILISTLRKEARAFVCDGIACNPTTKKYQDVSSYGELVPFALSAKRQENCLQWSIPKVPSS